MAFERLRQQRQAEAIAEQQRQQAKKEAERVISLSSLLRITADQTSGALKTQLLALQKQASIRADETLPKSLQSRR